MKKIVALGAVALLVLSAAPALAATRADRGDSRGSTNEPAPTPTPVPQPPHNGTNGTNGTIHNSSSVTANSGGNSGGNITTGDENASVHVENIGPTNNTNGTVVTPPVETTPPPTNEDTCTDSRGCRPSR